MKDTVHCDEQPAAPVYDEWSNWVEVLQDLEENMTVNEPTMNMMNHKHSKPVSECGSLRCYFCNNEDLAKEEATLVCRKCSTVVTRFVDNTPEWRFYGADDNREGNPARCGPPVNDLIPTMGASLFACHGGGAKRRGVQSSSYGHGAPRFMQRCHMWNSMTYKDRTLYGAFNTITLKSANHGITPCILEEAKRLYKRVAEGKFSRGDNRKALVACSVFMACKRNAVPRSVREITSMFDVCPMAMTKACKIFEKELDGDVAVAKSASPTDFVSRFCSKLNVDKEAFECCKEVVAFIEEHDLVTHCTPPSIVAGVIFMCCALRGIPINVHDIAAAAHISATTISKSHKQLIAHANLIFPILKGEAQSSTI